VLSHMLSHVDRNWTNARTALQIDARFQVDSWHIGGTAPDSKKILGHGSALPQVAGAVVASLLAEIAYHRDVNVWRAAVVERHGKALVLAGDDWESCVTLAAHLHTRGWRLLGGDYALVTCDTLSALCFKKALHANSSSVASFPLWYRPAFLKVDGHTAVRPALTTGEEFTLAGGLRRHDLMRCGVEVATLVRSDFSETCDFIERWFAALAL